MSVEKLGEYGGAQYWVEGDSVYCYLKGNRSRFCAVANWTHTNVYKCIMKAEAALRRETEDVRGRGRRL